jgi:hypothetical protein
MPRKPVDEDLELELQTLREKNDNLEDMLKRAEETLQDLRAAPPEEFHEEEGSKKEKPEMYLLIAALIVASRLILFMVVQKQGRSAFAFGRWTSLEALAGSALSLAYWGYLEEKRNSAYMVVKAIFIFLLLALCFDLASDGKVWSLRWGESKHVLPAGLAAFGGLLVIASAIPNLVLDSVMKMLCWKKRR